jgi:hypothetical protein
MNRNEFLIENHNKLSIQEMADVLKISKGSVSSSISRLRKIGLIPKFKYPGERSLETNSKICTSCFTEKPLDCFGKSKKTRDGHRNICKSCRQILEKGDRAKQWAKRKEIIANNPELKAKIAINGKLWRIKNKSKLHDQRNAYLQKIEVKEYRKIYINEYTKKRRYEDENFRLQRNWHKRIWDALNGICCSEKTQEILGLNSENFRIYIESKFKIGMSWANYGKKGIWEIDHIRPASVFDLTDYIQLRLCYHYSNLQPLFKEENQSKFNNNVILTTEYNAKKTPTPHQHHPAISYRPGRRSLAVCTCPPLLQTYRHKTKTLGPDIPQRQIPNHRRTYQPCRVLRKENYRNHRKTTIDNF